MAARRLKPVQESGFKEARQASGPVQKGEIACQKQGFDLFAAFHGYKPEFKDL